MHTGVSLRRFPGGGGKAFVHLVGANELEHITG
jgi:hypothetical protein